MNNENVLHSNNILEYNGIQNYQLWCEKIAVTPKNICLNFSGMDCVRKEIGLHANLSFDQKIPCEYFQRQEPNMKIMQ